MGNVEEGSIIFQYFTSEKCCYANAASDVDAALDLSYEIPSFSRPEQAGTPAGMAV